MPTPRPFERKPLRKPVASVNKTQIKITTTPVEFDLLTDIAEKQGMTKADYIREAIREKMDRG
jgi:predicted DNA-binding protein